MFSGAGSRPGGRGTFLCFAKEKYPKERRPCCACPFAALRATCDARSAGAAAELTARCALRSNMLRQVRARSACVLRHTHAPAALRFSARTEGSGETPGPSLRSAHARGKPSAARSARVPGRAKQWPVCGGSPPAGCACGGVLAGCACVPKDTHASCSDSPRLSERSAQREVSSAAAPRKRPDAGLPRSASAGVADWGSPFLCLLSFGEAKESECAVGRTSRTPGSNHSISTKNAQNPERTIA